MVKPKIVFDFPIDNGRYYVTVYANDDTAEAFKAIAENIGKDPTRPHILVTFHDDGIAVDCYSDSSQDKGHDGQTIRTQ